MTETTAAATRGRRQEKVGLVVSNRMDKTVVVEVEYTVMHRLYHRYQKRTSKFYATTRPTPAGWATSCGSCRAGLSRLKRWTVSEILERAQED
jgi:small subunit ribosomal protein S17